MAKLVLSLDGEVIRHCFLDKERVTIGRDAQADLVVEAPEVSKAHAEVLTVVNDHILQDLGSTNGTSVNGRRIARHILRNGDVIELGAYRVKYLSTKRAGAEFDRTLIMPAAELAGLGSPAAQAAGAAKTAPAARTPRANFPRALLKGIAGEYGGRQVELDRVLLPLGRHGAELAVINRRPHGFFLTHVEGAKRPLLNGEAIGAQPRLLCSGDTIEVGAEKVLFESL